MIASNIAELPLVGGHPALDLVNTVSPRAGAGAERHDHLREPGDVLVWARRAELLDAAEAAAVEAAWTAAPAAADGALRTVLDTREALYTALRALRSAGADTDARARAVEYLSMRWAAAAARTDLVLDRAGARLAVGSAPALLVADRLAYLAVELLCDLDPAHLRACPPEDGGCGWLFLDQSRNGTRRWCVMAGCGAKAKARRLTERRRAARRSSDYRQPARG